MLKHLIAVVAISWASVCFGSEPSSLAKQECPTAHFREIPIKDARSTGKGGVRVDRVSLCVGKRDRRSYLYFRAAAMFGHESFPNMDHAPWVHLSLRDSEDKEIVELKKLVVATVECEGYQSHKIDLPREVTNEQLARTVSAVVTLGGTKAKRC